MKNDEAKKQTARADFITGIEVDVDIENTCKDCPRKKNKCPFKKCMFLDKLKSQ
jgi:hypothetical protein